MSRRLHLSTRWFGATSVVVALVLSVVSVVTQDQTDKPKKSHRTPWGHPDLQGVWTSDSVTGIPLERPRTEPLTPEEKTFQERVRAVEKDVDPGGSNVIWNEREVKLPFKRPQSLVIDPPDGRVPITAEVHSLICDFERDVKRYGVGLSSWEELDLWDRCITKGFPTVMMPLGHSNMYQIFQTPEYVAIYYEVIHDVRVIPVDGRPHVGDQL